LKKPSTSTWSSRMESQLETDMCQIWDTQNGWQLEGHQEHDGFSSLSLFKTLDFMYYIICINVYVLFLFLFFFFL
jgi:hypothetical protein